MPRRLTRPIELQMNRRPTPNVKPSRRPEDSIPLRLAVLGAVLTGTFTLIFQGAVTGLSGMLAPPALVLAYWVSYRRRAADNTRLKLALTAAGVTAMFSFAGEIGAFDFDQARSNLALIFLWVQVLHSFDIPARRDLYFSLASSLVLMLVAATSTQGVGFGLMLAIYAGFAIAALVLAHRSEITTGTTPSHGTTRAQLPSWSDFARAGAATVAAAGLLFLLLPQPSGFKSFSLPFSLGSGVGSPSLGGIANPGFGSSPGSRSSGSSYYGFSQSMDLRVRGELSDEVVMRVRSSAPALWRGALFDTFDGTTWSGSRSQPIQLIGGGPYFYPRPFGEEGRRLSITQTFHIEAEQPSALFAAATPEKIWTTSAPSIDELGVLRMDSTLTPGTVYSIVSLKGAATAEELSAVPHYEMPSGMQRYLQLPPGLPDRVRSLAREITASATNDYERVRAIEAYLRENYRYSLDSPVPPEGQDAVDHFLFDAKVGFCEQFASGTAVMLRSLGIPTRVATGYTSGTKNMLTGLYEVKGSDAHAWVEVFFPGYGWYEFDPTSNVPQAAETGLADSIPIVRLVRAAAQGLGSHGPSVLGGVAVGSLALWLLLRRQGRVNRSRPRPATQPSPRVGPVTGAWLRFEAALERQGRGRRASETAAELARRIHRAGPKDTDTALSAFETERYGSRPPAPEDEQRAVDALERMSRATSSGAAADQ